MSRLLLALAGLLILPAIALAALAVLARAKPRRGRRRLPGPPYPASWTVTPGEQLSGDRQPAGSFLLLSGGPARLYLGDVLLTVEEGGVLRLSAEQRARMIGPVGAAATLWLASEAPRAPVVRGRVE